MHYIAEELDTEEWVKAGFERLERYLTCWRQFTDLYPETNSSSEPEEVRVWERLSRNAREPNRVE
jgi:hypothetical protein